MKRISVTVAVIVWGTLTSTILALEPMSQLTESTFDYSISTNTRIGLELSVVGLRNCAGQLEVTHKVRWSLRRPTWGIRLSSGFSYHFTTRDGKCTTIAGESVIFPKQFTSGDDNEWFTSHKITVPPGAVSLVVEFEGTELKTRPVPIPRR